MRRFYRVSSSTIFQLNNRLTGQENMDVFMFLSVICDCNCKRSRRVCVNGRDNQDEVEWRGACQR